MKYRSLRRVTQPTELPVTLAEFKAHARIDSEAEDSYVQTLLELATDYAEDATRRTFVTASYEMRLDAFPRWEMPLPRPPLSPAGDVEIEYDGEAGTTTLPANQYVVDRDMTPGTLYPLHTGQWPVAVSDKEGAVRVRWNAGYGDSAAVPRKVKHLILMLANHWYMNREPASTAGMRSIPLGAEALIGNISWGQYDG